MRTVLASTPPMPPYYPRMKMLNAAGAPALHPLPGGIALTSQQVESMRGTATLLDVRSPEAFSASHIRGSINIGAGASLSLWAGWLLDPDRPIVLIGDGDLTEIRRSLLRVGLDNIAGHLHGGMAAWITAGLTISSAPPISATEASQLGHAILLDVRDNQERAGASISGSLHVMLGNLSHSFDTLQKDQPVITICESGYRASIAASLLASAGFKDVRTLSGGMDAWKRTGLPVV